MDHKNIKSTRGYFKKEKKEDVKDFEIIKKQLNKENFDS